MARFLTALAVCLGLVVGGDVAVDRLVRADVAATRADLERKRAFQDFFFARMRDLQADIGLATVRAHARWAALDPTRRPGELRIVLVGNSAAIFAVAPGKLERRLASIFPDRTVTVVPLLVPSATIVDQNTLASAAIARSADVVVSFVDWDGYRMTPGVASPRIHELFAADDDGAAPGIVARVQRWLDRHWTLYRTHPILRARAVAAATRFWPALGEQAPLAHALARIEAASRAGDVRALFAAYDQIGYHPLLRRQYRGDQANDAPTSIAVEALGKTLGHAGVVGIAVAMPFNPLLRGDALGDARVDPRASDAVLRAAAADVIERLRRAGCETTNALDALPSTDFIDYVHVNAHGAEEFSNRLARVLRGVLQRRLAGSDRGAATGILPADAGRTDSRGGSPAPSYAPAMLGGFGLTIPRTRG